MEPSKAIFTFYLGNLPIDIKPEVIIQFFIVLFILAVAWWSTKNLKIKPNKKQTVVEWIYSMIRSLVVGNVGDSFSGIVPFVGTMIAFLLIMNLAGLVGIAPPT